jgi:glycosyltransferase involved in cell wall biosynthesis
MQRLPLLVSRVGGMAELLKHQQTGYLVPAGDPTKLGEGLKWLLTHRMEAQGMGQAAFELVSQQFNPTVMIQETLAVYRGA